MNCLGINFLMQDEAIVCLELGVEKHNSFPLDGGFWHRQYCFFFIV